MPVKDRLNSFKLFPSSDPFGIPDLEPLYDRIDMNQRYNSFSYRSKCPGFPALMHFFQDDFRFEDSWTNPGRFVEKLKGPDYFNISFFISPDFSMSLNWPGVVNLWQLYRARWLTEYMRSHGLKTVPCLNWADRMTYLLGVVGLPKNDVYALNFFSRQANDNKYWDGLDYQVKYLSPKLLIVYCPESFQENFLFRFPGLEILFFNNSDWKTK